MNFVIKSDMENNAFFEKFQEISEQKGGNMIYAINYDHMLNFINHEMFEVLTTATITL